MSTHEYTRAITALITQHMTVIGGAAALSLARKNGAVTVADNGDVLAVTGDPKEAFAVLASAYESFAGEVSRAIVRSLERAHPDLSPAHRDVI